MVLFSKNNVPKYVLYKPRLSLHEVLFPCKIKDHHNHVWNDGLAYRDVETGEFYARSLTSFEADKDKWEVFYS